MIKILGAGLSGLTSAINLKRAGRKVVIYEKNSSVGKQIHPNLQCLLGLDGKVEEYLKQYNLNPHFKKMRVPNAILSTRTKDVHVRLKTPADFVMRGGKSSLEYGLYKQAKEMGVEFKFSETIKNSDIVSTGTYRCDMLAYGEIYRRLNLEDESFFYMHDDRYSPVGWYLYIVPLPDGTYEIVNCTSKPHTNKTKMLLERAKKRRPILREIIGKHKPVDHFGGMGGFEYNRPRVIDGKLYVGEAAGFQDIFRGFGIKYAIESGYLAAKAIIEGKNYEKLWRKKLLKTLKTDMSRKGIANVIKEKAFEMIMKTVNDGDLLDWNKVVPTGIKQKIITSIFYRYELYHKWRRGYW